MENKWPTKFSTLFDREYFPDVKYLSFDMAEEFEFISRNLSF